MSQDIHVLHRAESDGSDIFTICRDDESYRFEGIQRDETYWLEFEEGIGYRAQHLTKCPDACWQALLQSTELAEAIPESAERVSRQN